MPDPILDPLTLDPLGDLRRRVYMLEQAPKVVEVLPLPAVPLVAVGGANWDVTLAAAGAFASLWRATIPVLALPGLSCEFAASDTGAAGEVRVVVTRGAESATSSVFSYTVGGQWCLGWRHGLDAWKAGVATVEFQARKVSGAGSFIVGEPIMTLLNVRACTAAGTWYPSVFLPV